ncbi:hypothetical protein [Nonomuraea wenchangensis]|uniref:hypothetical protein n=1 Tax=Nonomuraea wenchangensis TaxID=568860 RepID=UPI003433BA23
MYRLNIDNDGDNLTDIAFSWVFSSPASDGSQTYSFFNTDDTKVEYNASEPVNDRERWTDQFVHLLGHTGGYSQEEAVAAIDEHGLLPDVLGFDPSKPAAYPNGRTFTEDVIDIGVAFLTKNEAPPTGLQPHTDTLDRFPYLGDPHPAAT